MENKDKKIKEFIDKLKAEPLVSKYLYKHPWVSGSTTTVNPIMVWANQIELQWDSDKRIFGKFIQRIVNANSDIISSGTFWKSDGSCPSTIIFYLKK